MLWLLIGAACLAAAAREPEGGAQCTASEGPGCDQEEQGAGEAQGRRYHREPVEPVEPLAWEARPRTTAPFYTLVGDVGTAQWSDSALDELVRQDVPAKVAAVPLGRWCVGSWTPQYIAERLPRLANVKQMPPRSAELFNSDLPMAQEPDCLAGYRSHFSRHNMTAAEFFRLATAPAAHHGRQPAAEAQGVVSFASPLRQCGELQQDVAAEELATGEGPQAERFNLPYLWMGQAGALTPAHYDNYHNVYRQVIGQKTFVLIPPAGMERLDLYPSLHPAHRSAQARLDRLDRGVGADTAAFPRALGVEAWRCTLQPNETLFLPALWGHLVLTDSFSVSVNVWSEYGPVKLADEALAHTAALFTNEFDSFAGKVQLLRAYLSMLLSDLAVSGRPDPSGASTAPGGDARARAFVRDHLLDGRYRRMPLLRADPTGGHGAQAGEAPPAGRPSPGSDQWPRFCRDADELSRVLAAQPFLVHVVQQTHRTITGLFEEVRAEAGPARFRTLLLNIVERTAYSALGARHVHQFLHDFVHC